jgi:Terpene synthase, N-terminal domain
MKKDKDMERVYKLKKEVSQMIYKEALLVDKLELVDAIQQLGVAYHFEDVINSVINQSIDQISSSTMRGDLYEASLLFRLLRMHGFSVHEGTYYIYV